MIFVNKNPLHVLGIHENINFEGNSSCTSSEIRLRQSRGLTNTCFFWRVPDQKMFGTSPRARQARAKKISAILVKITGKIPFMHPLREARGVPNPLKQLEGVRYPLRSNEGVEADPSDTSRRSKPAPPSTRSSGSNAPPRTLLHPPGRSMCNTDNASTSQEQK